MDVGVWRAFKAKAILSGKTTKEFLEEVIKRGIGAYYEGKGQKTPLEDESSI
ncbi:MAG: hypothetical protein QXR41_06830 [Nitrososphaerota archaeon]